MQLTYRKYLDGDETKINNLYRLITGIDRSRERFNWEWKDTWDGQGEMHLLFDEKRASNDDLVAQYSLIPVPLSVFGVSYLSGKTENCMCHPAYRKQRIFFQHEKQSFERAKERFTIFYTTAGAVSNWAVAKVRSKLGYIPFDSWSSYLFCLTPRDASTFILSELARNNLKSPYLTMMVSFFSYIIAAYDHFRWFFKRKKPAGETAAADYENIREISALWKRNKNIHGISVDRNEAFLRWRIVDNPNIQYNVLLFRKAEGVIGYAIYFVDQYNIMHVEDILADRKDKNVLGKLFDDLIILAKKKKLGGIYFKTLMRNFYFRELLFRKGFIDIRLYAVSEVISRSKKQFLVYLPEELKRDKKIFSPRNWYITNLVSEGRE